MESVDDTTTRTGHQAINPRAALAFATRLGGKPQALFDEMLDAFTVVAAPDELAGKIGDRYGATIEHVLPGFPSYMSETTATAVQ